MGSLKRYIELSSGGGSVAQQFAGGGTMNGSLTVTGTISASQYLGIVTSTGNEVYIGGNSVGANMLIGTNDNFNLNIETAGTTKMTVTSAGNVGIGTPTPVTRLHVNGEYNNNGIYISRGASPIGYLGSYSSYTASGNNDSLILATYGSNCLINPSTGNVGIGTTAPAAKLQVGPGDSGNLVVIPGAGGSDGSFALRWSSDERIGFTSNAVQYGISGVSGGAIKLGGGSNFGYIIGNSSNGNILLNPTSGNVGIGTTAPGAKLHVIGNAIFGENVVSGSATPLNVSLGGSYGTSTPGSKANLKLDIYRDETGGRAGIGISGGLMEFQGPTGAGFGFYPNNGTVSALRILANGNVGIATTAPSYIFSVKPNSAHVGQIGFSTLLAFASPALYLEDYSGTVIYKFGQDNSGALKLLNNSNTVCFETTGLTTTITGNGSLVQAGNGTTTIQGNYGKILLDAYTNNAIQFFAGTAMPERMRILGSNGNVGIGTTNPQSNLEVYGATSTITINTGDGTTTAGLRFAHRDSVYADSQIKAGILAPAAGLFGLSTGLFFALNNATDNTNVSVSDSKLAILANGNVGVGTSTPTADFQVNQPANGEGLITVLAGSTAVTGTGTQFLNTFRVGDSITSAGQTLFVTAIGSNLAMTTTAAGATITNQPYTLTGGTRLSVFGNGNVGIGLTNPEGRLEVYHSHGINGGTQYGFKSIIVGGSNNTNVAGYFSVTGGSGQVALRTGTGKIDFYGELTTNANIIRSGNIFLGAIPSATQGNLQIGDNTTNFAAGGGGILTFSGDTAGQAGGATRSVFASIRGIKENGTYLNSLGALAFGTQSTAADQSQLSTVTEKMRITSTGNVGIGTSTPTEKLQVSGAIRVSGDFANWSTNTGALFYAGGKTGLLSSGPDTSTVGGFLLRCATSDGTGAAFNALTVEPTGCIGIGNVTPTNYTFSVNPTPFTGATGNWGRIGRVYMTGAGSGSYPDIGYNIRSVGGSYVFDVADSAAWITIDGNFRFKTGGSGAAGAAIIGTERLTILASNGNVGIGTTTPGAKLQINVSNGTPEEALRLLTTNGSLNNGSYISFFSQANELGRIKGLTTSGGSNIGQILLNPVYAGTELNGIKILASSSFATVSINTTIANSGLTVKSSYNGATILSLLDHADIEKFTVLNSGNLGIGTTTPASKVTVTGGDIELTDASAGVIFKTPDGTKRYRMTINNAGGPVFTLLS